MNNTIHLSAAVRMLHNTLQCSRVNAGGAEGSTQSGKAQQGSGTDFARQLIEQYIPEGAEPQDLTGSITRNMTMDEYKQYIYDRISRLAVHESNMQDITTVNISDEGFHAMKDAPEYEAWVLDTLKVNFMCRDPWSGVCGGKYNVFSFGAAKEDCRMDSWRMDGGKDSWKPLGDKEESFWERRAEQIRDNLKTEETKGVTEQAKDSDTQLLDMMLTTEERHRAIQEKIDELLEKIRKGELAPSIPTGAGSFTLEEWEKQLEKFDRQQEEMRRNMRVETGSTETAQEPEKTGVSNKEEEVPDLEALVSESTVCTYPSHEPGEEEVKYITWYTKEGIFCRKAGQQNGYEWTISFTRPEQYEKVMDFLADFSGMKNLRFAAHENFWQDFLEDRIDIEDLKTFMAETKDGIPEYTYTVGDSTYVDRDKAKYAVYMNDFGAKFYTAEEFQRMQEEIIKENAKKLRKLGSY